MAESAALLADEVFPEHSLRQWGLRVPDALRLLFASRPAIKGQGPGYEPARIGEPENAGVI